jgi:hypothetical protein
MKNENLTDCPSCLGNKQVFDGEDFSPCGYCEASGMVSELKLSEFDPLDEISLIEEEEENDYQDTE